MNVVRSFLPGVVASLVCVCLPAGPVFADGPLKMKVEAQGSVLPYQALRVRVSLTNEAKAQLAPLVPLTRGVYWVSIQEPAGTQPRDFRQYYLSGTGLTVTGLSGYESPLQKHDKRLMNGPLGTGEPGFGIEPGQTLSLSLAEGNEKGLSEEDAFAPSFPEPGRYKLRLRYDASRFKGRPEAPKQLVYEAELEVTVAKPAGVDEKIAAMLDKTPDLADAMCAAHYAPEEKGTVAALEEILKLAPDSSYAPYARFALARCRLGTKGIGGIEGFQVYTAHELPEDRRKEALAELKQIKTDKFAYGPQVLVLQRLLENDPAEQDRLGKLLKTSYPDSIERAEDDANRAAGYPKKREKSE